jgi:lipoate-protein ligase B
MNTSTQESTICQRYWLGRLDYQHAWRLQKALAEQRGAHLHPDSLLLVEHPPTYTLGSSGKYDHLLLSPAELSAQGICVYEVDRGGDITYHGPGQLVGYPILQLPVPEGQTRPDVVAYVRHLEEMLLLALGDFGIVAERLPKYTGVWVNWQNTLHKIAAIGVKVTTQGVTYHGFALNINTEMRYFQGIVPCGIPDKPVVSLAQLLGHPVDFSAVCDAVEKAFELVFQRRLVVGDPVPLLTNLALST